MVNGAVPQTEQRAQLSRSVRIGAHCSPPRAPGEGSGQESRQFRHGLVIDGRIGIAAAGEIMRHAGIEHELGRNILGFQRVIKLLRLLGRNVGVGGAMLDQERPGSNWK